MNLKTFTKTAIIGTGIIAPSSFFLRGAMQPHSLLTPNFAHSWVIPDNLKGAARDSFNQAKSAVYNEEDNKIVRQVIKAHNDTCTWCKACKINEKVGEVIEKPFKAIYNFTEKMMQKIPTKEETYFKVDIYTGTPNSKQCIKHVNDSIKSILNVSKVKDVAKSIK